MSLWLALGSAEVLLNVELEWVILGYLTRVILSTCAITPPLTGPGLVGVRALDRRTNALGPVERKSLPQRVVHRTGPQGFVAVIPLVLVVVS